MVVDDSAVVRGLETRMLESDPAIKVVASVGNGQVALQALDRHDVEVVVLDIEMPVMDGLTALPQLLRKNPALRIIMSSTLTQKNAEVSLKAIELGATEYIPKPSSSRELTGGADFKTELVEKVKALGASARKGTGVRKRFSAESTASGHRSTFTSSASAAPAAAAPEKRSLHAGQVTLRKPGTDRPDVIAIGSSTGGPQALFTVLSGLKKAGGVTQPILITQHMPATFTTILAEHISRLSGFTAKEATNGEKIVGGHVYVAPGDYHMLVDVKGTEKVIRLDQGPPENFCRPSVDPMYRSIAKAWGARKVLACVLTGMGSDGAKGGTVIADGGGTVIAQDEASSVVWGMPGATAHAGACAAVLPIGDIAGWIHKFANRRS